MEVMADLIQILNKKKLSKIDVLDRTFLNQKKDNLYYTLYNAIAKKQVLTDSEAAKLLYNTTEKDARYKMLKSRLKQRVLKTALLLDTEETFINTQGRAYYECSLKNQIIEIIINLSGTTKLVYELVKEDYNKALKYKFYDVLRNYSFYLISYYSLTGNKKMLLREEENFIKYQDLAQKEQFAKYIYMKSTVDFNHPTPINNELLENTKNNVDQLYKLKNEIKNPEIDFYYYYLALMYFENSNKIHEIIELCEEADSLMKVNPSSINNTRKMVIILYRIKALLMTKQFFKGLHLIKNIESNIIIPPTSYNWYVIKEIEFKLYLQSNDISNSQEVYNQVLENKSYKRQAPELTERWKIYNAYLVFMDNYLNKGDFKFSLAKFLNEVPVNSKDKSGFNFAIRIIEILFHAARKDYNLIFSKMDALRIYRSRYLNDNTYKRNHLFLGALMKAEKTGFDGKEMAKADWQELKELRIPNKYLIADWEIIPYETLWDIFVELAKQ